jgi:hypothetical protein
LRSPRRLLIATIAALAFSVSAGLGTALGANYAAGPLVQVSGNSPFPAAGCAGEHLGTQSGTVSLNSEVEPWIDVNPTDPGNIVGIFQQDRWSNGGARGLVTAASMDGGSTWSAPRAVDHTTACAGGTADPERYPTYERATDPWLSFGPEGRLYQLSLSFNDIVFATPPKEMDPTDFDHALLASFSDDGGLTWSDPEVVLRDLEANVFNDKQTITADPTDADNVYAVWDRLIFPASVRANAVSGFVTAASRGPIWFARSTDGGLSWEPARQLYDPGQNDQTIANQIVVLPNGTLVNLFAEFHGDNKGRLKGWTVRLIRSTNQGVTWSSPITVSPLQTIGVTDPETGDDVRTGDIIPDVAVDPSSGALYAAWQDARFSNFAQEAIAFSQSTDGGLNWSEPIQVNATPTNLASGNQQAFTPSVDVADDGTVAVTYYDFRNNTSAASLLTDYWAVHCHPADDCADPDSWDDEDRLTSAPFDMRQAPLTTTGFFTGDYEGLASAGADFTPFFSQPHGSDPSSTFFRRLGP